MQLFQINQSEESSKITTINAHTISGQLHQRSITTAFTLHLLSFQDQRYFTWHHWEWWASTGCLVSRRRGTCYSRKIYKMWFYLYSQCSRHGGCGWALVTSGQDSGQWLSCDHPAHHRPGNSVNSKHHGHHTATFHHCLHTVHCPPQMTHGCQQ